MMRAPSCTDQVDALEDVERGAFAVAAVLRRRAQRAAVRPAQSRAIACAEIAPAMPVPCGANFSGAANGPAFVTGASRSGCVTSISESITRSARWCHGPCGESRNLELLQHVLRGISLRRAARRWHLCITRLLLQRCRRSFGCATATSWMAASAGMNLGGAPSVG